MGLICVSKNLSHDSRFKNLNRDLEEHEAGVPIPHEIELHIRYAHEEVG
jgi:hypothetical protein